MKNKNLKQRNTTENRRRGMAIEMAILFMLVVVALSGLAVSAYMMQIDKIDRAYEKMEQRMVLDQIGEDFCNLRGSYTPPQEVASVYNIVNTGTALQVYPRFGEEISKPVLSVELTIVDGKYTVTQWSYGE